MHLAHLRKHGALVVLAVLLVFAAYGVYRTRSRPPTVSTGAAPRGAFDGSVSVDQSSLITVEQLLRFPTSPDERSYAQNALRIADQEFDLAFAQAVRQAASRPRVITPAATEANARLQQGREALATDKADSARLAAELTRAKPADIQSLNDRIALANAMIALDQDEIDDAEQDLIRAGGAPQTRMERMTQEHAAAAKGFDTLRVLTTPPDDTPGLVHRLSAWQALRDKASSLAAAKASADSLAVVLKQRHDRVEARSAARLRDSSARSLTHDSTEALVAAAQRQALQAKSLVTLDKRVDNQHALADVYAGWIKVLNVQERVAINHVLRSLVALVAILIIVVLLSRWTERVTVRLTLDRRRAQTLHMIVRVTLQVLGVFGILLVIFGRPSNLGTFLGLAGAGLTVALKDFIVGFIGWFVLMGSDGIRIGDLVEINGVTGEVVEVGMFHTVLLETGNWSGAGHPTGRRVTFSNTFAVEGHYFNFSSSGQWLWDEVEIVVPHGQDPNAIAEALRSEVEKATAETARQAEAEWKGSRRAPQFTTLTAAPSVSMKPIPGGVEISVRYVTRVTERGEIRDRLYAAAMRLLGAAI